MKCIRKSVEVEAVRWNGQNQKEIEDFAGDEPVFFNDVDVVENGVSRIKHFAIVLGPKANFRIDMFDYIIKEADGTLHPCGRFEFDAIYSEINDEGLPFMNLSFEEALIAIKRGGLLCRDGWNGEGMFVFMGRSEQIRNDVVGKMSCLPGSFKDWLMSRKDSAGSIDFSKSLYIKKPDDTICSWVPSVGDIFAEDWRRLYYR